MNRRPVRALLLRMLQALAALLPGRPRMTVLLYHAITDAPDFYAVSPAVFARQMQYLKEKFEVVPLARAFQHAAGTPVTRSSVAITFDDGYQDFRSAAFPILKRFNIPSTVFVLGEHPERGELGNEHALLSSGDLHALAQEPLVSIGSHGYTHKKLSKLPADEARRELNDSRRTIEKDAGTAPAYLAYPKGSHNAQVMELAKEAGFAGAVSVIEHGVREGSNAYALPRVQVDGSTAFSEFQAKLTRASDWYYALWKLIH